MVTMMVDMMRSAMMTFPAGDATFDVGARGVSGGHNHLSAAVDTIASRMAAEGSTNATGAMESDSVDSSLRLPPLYKAAQPQSASTSPLPPNRESNSGASNSSSYIRAPNPPAVVGPPLLM